MKPAIVIPMHDPDGIFFPLLARITPALKSIFERAIISIPPTTRRNRDQWVRWAEADPWFLPIYTRWDGPAGRAFRELYIQAAGASPNEQVLHLGYIDRLAFAVESDYQRQYLDDAGSVKLDETPLIFHRSPHAWDTHPQNYRQLEGVVTKVGQLVYGKELDFGWCYLAIRAGELAEVMPHTHNPDISLVAEMVIQFAQRAQTREVDWLAWEDPFILGLDAQLLKAERETSPDEHRKRLDYVIPMLQLLHRELSKNGRGNT